MERLFFGAMVIFLLQNCTTKIEIPNQHVGILSDNGKVILTVLEPGEHLVSSNLMLIIYDVVDETVEIEGEFLFKDASQGNVEVNVEFKPIADSLARFYQKYDSRYIKPVVIVQTRRVVRNLLKNYGPNELTREKLQLKIIKEITDNNPITNYVKLNKVNVVELKF